MSRLSVGVTERRTFRRCRLAWRYAYKDRLALADAGDRATALGWVLHQALAVWYENDRTADLNTLFLAAAAQEGLSSERINEGRDLVRNYIRYRLDTDWDVRHVGLYLRAHVPGTRADMIGEVDMVVARSGRLWLVDHKTARSYATPSKLETDDQMTAYIWLAQRCGYNVRGALYNEIGKRKTPPFVQVAELVRSNAQLLSFQKNLTLEVRDMTSKNTRVYPSFDQHCAWCEYRSLCITENDSGDTKRVIETFYKPRPLRRDSNEEE